MPDTYPSARDVERAVLGAALLSQSCAERLCTNPDNLFYTGENLLVFKAMKALAEAGQGIDQLTVAEALKSHGTLEQAGGEVHLAGLAAETRSTANLDHHIGILRHKSALRKIMTVAKTALKTCGEHDADPETIAGSVMTHLKGVIASVDEQAKPLSDMVREWVLSSDGVFLLTDVCREFALSSRADRKNVSQILHRLTHEGLIERWGPRRGTFRRIEGECQRMDWLSAPAGKLDIRWPFGIERYVDIMPGNIAVVAGEPNSGKTAFLLNFVRQNMASHEVHYFSSEMGAGELHRRIEAFNGIAPQDWRFHPWERSSNFADVVRPGAVNVIDFLEIHEDFYKVGGQLKAIHDRLDGGIALVALQKNRDTDLGRGGIASLEKPRLYLALAPGECTIVKGKNWAQQGVNPNGLKLRYKLAGGANFSWDEWM